MSIEQSNLVQADVTRPILPSFYPVADSRLRLVATDGEDLTGVAAEQPAETYNRYLAMRDICIATPKVEGAELEDIQNDVSAFLAAEGILDEPESYTTYSRETSQRKIGSLINYLEAVHGDKISPVELETTRLFLDSAFGMYEDAPDVSPEMQQKFDGSFAFIVPPRVSRDNQEFGGEVEPTIPALRYVRNKDKAPMLVGLPPFIIDVYKPAHDGREGYLIYTPVYADHANELIEADGRRGQIEFLQSARDRVNDAADFATNKLGVNIAGLGATLPSYTMYGQKIRNESLITTTGHGGTTYMVTETIRQSVEQGYLDGKTEIKLGMLGAGGSIGTSMAELMAVQFPEYPMEVYDKFKPNEAQRLVDKLNNHGLDVSVAASAAEVIENSDIIVSAIVGKIALSDVEIELGHPLDLTNKIVIDDSQPNSFDPEEVEARGGQVAWVIGHDTKSVVERRGYDYGSLSDSKHDVFGCEAEAGVLARRGLELARQGISTDAIHAQLKHLALREAVTPTKAAWFGILLDQFGIGVAPFQNFGKTIEQPAEA